MMRNQLVLMFLLSLIAISGGCGDDNPADPDPDPGGGDPTALEFDDFQAAALVIGQFDKESRLADAGGSTSAVGMARPVGAGCGSLYIPDALNNRVLGFIGIPTADGAAASFVLGQPSFSSTAEGTTAQSFRFPADCAVADGKLFVVDTGNHRVLIWNSLPTSNVPADVVVGQVDFTSSAPATTPSGLANPFRVAIGDGKLFVCDVENHRVLIWNTIPDTSGTPASVVVGQEDFETAVPGLTASKVRSPGGLWTDGTRLVVGDVDNRRVLIWNSIPTTNGEAADVVVGAETFGSQGSSVPSATSISFPSGVASDGTSLFVADRLFHRVLIFTPFPTANGATATGVLGQASFSGAAHNDANQDGVPDSHPTAQTLYSPRDVKIMEDRLFVAEESNNRVTVFEGR